MRFRENEINDPLLLSERKVGERVSETRRDFISAIFVHRLVRAVHRQFSFFPPPLCNPPIPQNRWKSVCNLIRGSFVWYPWKQEQRGLPKNIPWKKKVRRFVEPSSKSSSNRVKNTLPLPMRNIRERRLHLVNLSPVLSPITRGLPLLFWKYLNTSLEPYILDEDGVKLQRVRVTFQLLKTWTYYARL